MASLYTNFGVMSITNYTFFRVKLHKEILSFSCNITLVFVYTFCYNIAMVEERKQYTSRPHTSKERRFAMPLV